MTCAHSSGLNSSSIEVRSSSWVTSLGSCVISCRKKSSSVAPGTRGKLVRPFTLFWTNLRLEDNAGDPALGGGEDFVRFLVSEGLVLVLQEQLSNFIFLECQVFES